MATFNRLPTGYWRAQVRHKGQYASRSFRLKSDAEAWALEAEGKIERGESVDAAQVDATTTFGFIIDWHIPRLGRGRQAAPAEQPLAL